MQRTRNRPRRRWRNSVVTGGSVLAMALFGAASAAPANAYFPVTAGSIGSGNIVSQPWQWGHMFCDARINKVSATISVRADAGYTGGQYVWVQSTIVDMASGATASQGSGWVPVSPAGTLAHQPYWTGHEGRRYVIEFRVFRWNGSSYYGPSDWQYTTDLNVVTPWGQNDYMAGAGYQGCNS